MSEKERLEELIREKMIVGDTSFSEKEKVFVRHVTLNFKVILNDNGVYQLKNLYILNDGKDDFVISLTTDDAEVIMLEGQTKEDIIKEIASNLTTSDFEGYPIVYEKINVDFE